MSDFANYEHLFTYHPPTGTTTPLYAAVRKAEVQASVLIETAVRAGAGPNFGLITAAAMDYAVVICEVAPNCDDRAAALRAVRLARMAFNEAAISAHGGEYRHNAAVQSSPLLQQAANALREARWWACAAIATNVKD